MDVRDLRDGASVRATPSRIGTRPLLALALRAGLLDGADDQEIVLDVSRPLRDSRNGRF